MKSHRSANSTYCPSYLFRISRSSTLATTSLALSALALCPALGIQLLAQTPNASVATVAVNSPAVPHLIRYSGTLIDGHGYPITVPIDAAFSMYEQPAVAGTEEPAALWTETQHVTPNEKGVYTVYLGAATPKGLPASVFTSVTAQYLGVKLEGEAELPRTLLVSVPYAFKAGDAQTLGGLPASAYALAGSQFTRSAAASNGPAPDGITNVTTAGGTAGFLPQFSGANSVLDSPVFISGSNVGIGTKTPSATFQVNGPSALAATSLSGTLKLNATGSATTAVGKPSELQTFQASAYNASVHEAVPQTFAWQALPISNDTANASGALGLLFGSGSAAPAATGLSIAKNGVVTFAAGQTFPGTGKGNGTVTGITAGTDLIGGGTSGNITLSLNTTKVVTGVTAGTGLTGGGSAGAVSLSLDTTKIPTLTDNPTFTGTITANSKTANKPAIAANGTNGGLGIIASSTTASAGRFSTGSASVPSLSSSTSSSTGGYAIYGTTPGIDGIGVYSNASGAGAYGIYSIVSGGLDSVGSAPIGIFSEAINLGIGVEGNASGYGTGVAGESAAGTGLYGMTTTGEGVYATATTGMAGYFQNAAPEGNTVFAYNGASANSSSTLPVAIYGESLGTQGVGVEGFSGAGVGVRGTSGESSNLGSKFQNDQILAGVWGDTGGNGGYPILGGILGSADDNTAGYFQNSSATIPTIGAFNGGGGGTGLFKTLQASTSTGTCGFGSGDLTCTGQVKTLAITGNGEKRLETYVMQSPENWMEDFGAATINHGVAIVTIDPAFVETANTSADYHVFLTPNGDSKGLYVVAKGPSTFEVHESGSGNSTLTFDYRVVAKRRGYEGQRLVDVTAQFQTETAFMAKRIQLAQDAHATRIKPPTPPAPHVVHTPRAAFAPQMQPALAVKAVR